jgi:hypothetical protein
MQRDKLGHRDKAKAMQCETRFPFVILQFWYYLRLCLKVSFGQFPFQV